MLTYQREIQFKCGTCITSDCRSKILLERMDALNLNKMGEMWVNMALKVKIANNLTTTVVGRQAEKLT